LLRVAEDGRLPRGCVVVCTLTGHGLKDPDTALRGIPNPEPIAVDPTAVATALSLA
jgi:threonine synthase